MVTIKLPYNTTNENNTILDNLRKHNSNIVRYSYNRLKEDKSEKDIRLLIKNLNNINDLNSWMIQCGIKEGKAILEKNKDDKVIFGSKKHFYRRIKGLINNEQLKKYRMLPLTIQGEETKMGNRLFKLDIINNNQVIFKITRDIHINLKLPNLKNNYKNILYKLEQINDIKQDEKGLTYTVKLDSDNIYISFNEQVNIIKTISNRYIGIDLNPENIGISIMEDDKILELRHFLFKTKSYNKTEYEIYEISKKVEKLFKKWNCKFIFIEDLTIKSKEYNKDRKYNKLINQWIRNKFINNLEKRITNLGGKIFKVNPAYSSFIGNLIYNYSDPINASLEIGRRGYEVIILKNKKFYPELSRIKDQWKEYLTNDINSWKEFFSLIKNLELRYRVSLNEQFNVLSYLSKKSNIYYFLYTF